MNPEIANHNHTVLLWWESLTSPQRKFLIDQYIFNHFNEQTNTLTVDEVREYMIHYWYGYSLGCDIHKIQGWPETTIDDMRKI